MNFVKEKLEIEYVRFAPIDDVDIEKIAICSGSRGEFIKNAIDAKVVT